MNEQNQQPEYDLTKHEIDAVNQDRFLHLGREWIEKNGLSNIVDQKPLSFEENEAAGKVAGSSHNIIMDFDHNQEPIMGILSMASDHAYSVKRKVTAMYKEAYEAKSDPDGPDHYFSEQQKSQRPKKLARILGRLAKSKS